MDNRALLHALERFEFALIEYRFEVRQPLHLDLEDLLRLRGPLLQAAKAGVSLVPGQTPERTRLKGLLEPNPPVAADARRRYQRPGPPFVIAPDPDRCGGFEAGDRWRLQVHFFGNGIEEVATVAALLGEIGRRGLGRGEGRFAVESIWAADPAGCWTELWQAGDRGLPAAPPRNNGRWLWERESGGTGPRELSFISPTRLMSRGKPLFNPSFRQIFPFILRRVTALAYTYCGVELVADPSPWLESAGQVRTVASRLKWQDWRQGDSPAFASTLGGFTGRMVLEGAALPDIDWLLLLGSVVQVGKGASYGCGRFLSQGLQAP